MLQEELRTQSETLHIIVKHRLSLHTVNVEKMDETSDVHFQNSFVNGYIKTQVSLLEREKDCIEQRETEDRKKYGDIYGSVLSQSEPPYGGVILSLKLFVTANDEGLGNPFKQGTPLAMEIDGTNIHLEGLVTVVR